MNLGGTLIGVLIVAFVALTLVDATNGWTIESHKTADRITSVEEPVQDGQTTVVKFKTDRDPQTVFTAVYSELAEF